MRAFGATEDQIEQARQHAEPATEDMCEVWEENWPSFLIFEGLATQWKITAGMGGALWTGLDYQATETLIRMRIPEADRIKVFGDVQVMERAALAVLNKN
jgi:hypothetical protein